MIGLGGDRGQASVEFIGLLPLLLVIVLAVGQALAAHIAHEAAEGAAQAGAMAILQGGEPKRAARAAVPTWARDRVRVAVSGRAVAVRVRPRAIIPLAGGALTMKAQANAGPVWDRH